MAFPSTRGRLFVMRGRLAASASRVCGIWATAVCLPDSDRDPDLKGHGSHKYVQIL